MYYNNKCIDDCSLLNTNNNSSSNSVGISNIGSITYVSDGSTCYACPTYCIDCIVTDSTTNTT